MSVPSQLDKTTKLGKVRWQEDSHLLPPEDQSLLDRWDALLFLNALLDPRNTVVRLDVQLNFLACEGAHSGRGSSSATCEANRRRGGEQCSSQFLGPV